MRFFNNLRIQNKLILSCVLVAIFPIILIAMLLSARLYEMSMNQMISLSSASLAQWKANYIDLLNSQNNIIDSLAQYKPLRSYTDTYYEEAYQGLDDYLKNIYPLLNLHSSKKVGQNNVTVKIYTDNPTIGFSSEINNSLADLERQDWYQANDTDEKYKWTMSTKQINGEKKGYVCCYTSIKDTDHFSKIKMVIAAFLPESSFYSLIKEEKDKAIFLCDDRGNILSATDRHVLSSNIKELNIQEDNKEASLENRSKVSYQGKNYVCLSTNLTIEDIRIVGWKLIYLLPQDTIMGEFSKAIASNLMICLACMVLSLIMIIFVAKNITDRLSNLAKNIHRLAQRNYKPIRLPNASSDEIGQIETDFNAMALEIETLITTVYEADLKMRDQCITTQKIEMKKKEAEMIALKAQINPHFLFNTLETIRMNLLIKDDRETADVMQVFAESIREHMSFSQELSTLEEEISFVRKYIFIQEYRFKDKLQLLVELQEGLRTVRIPRLLIQPLVENAVFHGIEPKQGKGTIVLVFSSSQKKLYINISDDGVGMEEAKLYELRKSLQAQPDSHSEVSQDHSSLALKNIHNRIQLMYGMEYGLTIHSKKGFGTEIEAVIPLFDQNNE